MKLIKKKINKSQNKLKIITFSKLNSLKERWNNKELKLKDISIYNKWSVEEKFKIIEIELRLEHYLCKNILIELIDEYALFQNKNKYFNKKYTSDIHFTSLMNNLSKNGELNEKQISIIRISELTLGQKIIIWKYLKKNIFKNKFLGIEKTKKQFIIALENIRNIRNGIAHLNSKKQIFAKMKELNSSNDDSKEIIYTKSINICRQM